MNFLLYSIYDRVLLLPATARMPQIGGGWEGVIASALSVIKRSQPSPSPSQSWEGNFMASIFFYGVFPCLDIGWGYNSE